MEQPNEVIIYKPEHRKAFIPAELDEYPLDPYEFRLYCRVARREGGGRGCDESVANMAEALGMSRRRAGLALELLVRAGLLTRNKRPGMSASYRTTATAKWIKPSEVATLRTSLKPATPRTTCAAKNTSTRAPYAQPPRTECAPPAHDMRTTRAPGAHKGNPHKVPPVNKPHKVKTPPTPPRGKFDPTKEALPECVTPEAWLAWCQHRKEIKKPLTRTSTKQQLAALAAHPADATAALYRSIASGWTGVFPKDTEQRGEKDLPGGETRPADYVPSMEELLKGAPLEGKWGRS